MPSLSVLAAQSPDLLPSQPSARTPRSRNISRAKQHPAGVEIEGLNFFFCMATSQPAHEGIRRAFDEPVEPPHVPLLVVADVLRLGDAVPLTRVPHEDAGHLSTRSMLALLEECNPDTSDIVWLTPSFRSAMKYSSLCGIGTSMSCSPAHTIPQPSSPQRKPRVSESKSPPGDRTIPASVVRRTVCEEHGRLDVADVRDRASLPVELMLPTRPQQHRWCPEKNAPQMAATSWRLTPTAFLQTRTRTEAGTSMCRLATIPQATGGQGTSSLERRADSL